MGFFGLFRKKKKTKEPVHSDLITVLSEKNSSATSEIDELSRLSQEKSDWLYQERQREVSHFNPYVLCRNAERTELLTSVEKYFLKQMNKQTVDFPTVYGYWKYEYNVEFCKIMIKLITNGYLYIANYSDKLPFLKVVDLQSILKKFSLPSTGKKSDLICRIQENLSAEQISAELVDIPDRYLLTCSGRIVTNNLPVSATKNLEFENDCLKLLFKADVNNAYKLVCQNEANKVFPRGLNMDWNKEAQNGLCDFEEAIYTTFLTCQLNQLPTRLAPLATKMKACVILGIMLGLEPSKTTDIFVRICGNLGMQKGDVLTYIAKYQFALMDAKQKYTFDYLSK